MKTAGDSTFAEGGTEQLHRTLRAAFRCWRAHPRQWGHRRVSTDKNSINGHKGKDGPWSAGTGSSVSPGGAIAMANLLAALAPVRHH